MIEILVTLVVTAVGMLGLAGFVVRATTLSADSIQRGRAALLVNDMATRISDHKAIAANFVNADDRTSSSGARPWCPVPDSRARRCSCASGTTCSPAPTTAEAARRSSATAAA